MAKKKKKVTKTVSTTVTEETLHANETTQIICILDRSRSMSSIMDDSIGGFNTFIKQQKELPDKATLTVALFDDKYELLYDNVDIKDVKEITNKEWFPRGTTALYDAIGEIINDVKLNHARLGEEAPSKVLVCVVTDGYENNSKEYKNDDIQKLIENCEKDDWNFIYLAANQDAFSIGSSFGISGGNTYTYAASTDGVFNMTTTLNDAAVSYRSMTTSDDNFNSSSKSLIDNEED
ncbi:MAG: VWA domain-containing protein [Bacteroidales bacterium]|jgi:hypothetical protein|nr:VWA domain-containing protein [Bacteroidales bacterium]